MVSTKIITLELLLKDRLSGGLDAAGKKTRSLTKRVQGVNKQLKQLPPGNINNRLVGMSRAVDNVNKRFKDVGKSLQGVRAELLSVGLAFLFTGMALQRVFNKMISSTVDFYKTTVDGQTMAAESLTRLAAGWQFLKFTVGEAIATALGPVVPLLLDIISRGADWIDRNQKLSGTLVILGAVVGSTMLVMGMFLLFVNGVLGVLTALGLKATALGGIFLKLGGAMKLAFSAALSTAIGAVAAGIVLVLGSVILLAKIWDRDSKVIDNSILNIAKSIMYLGKLAIAVFSGDMELSAAYFNVFAEKMVKGIIGLGHTIARVGVNIVEMFLSWGNALIWVLEIMDKVQGTNLAGKFQGKVSGLMDNARSFLDDRLDTGSLNTRQLELDALLASRESSAPAPQNNTTNIDQVNITGVENMTFDEIMADIERKYGPMNKG